MSKDNTPENKSKVNMRDIIRERFRFEITDDLLIKSKAGIKSNQVVINDSEMNHKVIKKDYYKRTKANDEALIFGQYLMDLNKKEYEKIPCKSDKLHFKSLLGLSSKKTNSNISRRRAKEGSDQKFEENTKTFSLPIGVRLKTDIDIEVPNLKDVTKNKDTGINLEEDIEYKTVTAGETFDLTLYEFMYLIIRDEYGGYLKVEGKDFYAHLSVKLPAFWRGDAKLPTPTIVFEKGYGSARSSILDIDEKTEQGWRIKPEFKERFGPLFNFYNSNNKRKSKRNNKGKGKVNSKSNDSAGNSLLNYQNPILYSLAMQEELGLQKGIRSIKIINEENLLDRGKEIVLSMDDRRRSLLGSKSATLHLVNILGFSSNNSFGGPKPIGVTLVSDEEVKVPIIDIKKDIKTGINPITDINYRTITAGVSFYVSNYEFMYLIIRDEYVGFCELGGDNKGAYLFPNYKLYFEGKNKLPIPNIKYSKDKTLSMVEIHQINENGIKEIKPEYSEKFGALLG
jgi:hypothetical protein